MSVHQCPKCELRFTWKTELDQHCRDEHPDFQHDYPAGHRMSAQPIPTPPTPPPPPR
jgi:hypothetical protein